MWFGPLLLSDGALFNTTKNFPQSPHANNFIAHTVRPKKDRRLYKVAVWPKVGLSARGRVRAGGRLGVLRQGGRGARLGLREIVNETLEINNFL